MNFVRCPIGTEHIPYIFLVRVNSRLFIINFSIHVYFKQAFLKAAFMMSIDMDYMQKEFLKKVTLNIDILVLESLDQKPVEDLI
jgi:hypothetical protein